MSRELLRLARRRNRENTKRNASQNGRVARQVLERKNDQLNYTPKKVEGKSM